MVKILSPIQIEVGRAVRRVRLEANITQRQLSRKLKLCSRTHLVNIENGINGASLEVLHEIVTALGLRLSDLFSGIS